MKMNINYEKYFDKVYGGFLGKCLGGAAGAPVEGFKKVIECEDYKQIMRPDLPNDDLDLQLLWLEVLQKKGRSVTSMDLAKAWDRQCWYPFNEYGIFLKNYERGIWPPYSGSFNNPLFSQGEGCPIRSEIWGMIFPGEPEQAAAYAEMDGCLDHAGEAVWIEQYYAAMEAQAFLTEDMQELICGQLHYLPEESDARGCVNEVLLEYQNGNRDWQIARTLMLRKYAHFDFTNAVTNLGIVIIALLYGQKDIDSVINTAFRCGFDTDCTCATAAAVYGIAVGADRIPESLKLLVNDQIVTGIVLERTDRSIRKLAEETCAVGLRMRNRTDFEMDLVKNQAEDISMKVLYIGMPAIGAGDSCGFIVELVNHSEKTYDDRLVLDHIPDIFYPDHTEQSVTLQPGDQKMVAFQVSTELGIQLPNTNLLTARYGAASYIFGIAGAAEWTAVGPFMEALDKEDPEGIPSAHGDDCVLPTLECMVNNAAYLNKAYLDETDFDTAFEKERPVLIHAYEDRIPLDDTFRFKGQGCIYIKQTLISPEEREVFVVIGNNDGFCLFVNGSKVLERDEIRLWTPYNNYHLISLNKGSNTIVLKLLRRTESLQLSFGLRKYEGEHFHRKRWYTDFECL